MIRKTNIDMELWISRNIYIARGLSITSGK